MTPLSAIQILVYLAISLSIVKILQFIRMVLVSIPASRELNLECSDESYICLSLLLLQSTSYLFFVYRSRSSQSCSVINSVSENIDKILLSHPSANIFVFGDFNIYHVEWLQYQ